MRLASSCPPLVGLEDIPVEQLPALLEALAGRGLRCAVIQLADEDFDPDIPGKDSHELRHAGVSQLLLAAERKSALLREYPPTAPDLSACLAQLAMDELDLLLVVDPPAEWLAADRLIHGQSANAPGHYPGTNPAELADYIHTHMMSPQSGDNTP